jgi:2-oxoglutarate ferredoxin oxidoreductase subunit beta
MRLEVIDANARPGDVLKHDETNPTLAQMLLAMQSPDYPVALGVVYRNPAPSYEEAFYSSHVTGMQRTTSVADALRKTNTWWVK